MDILSIIDGLDRHRRAVRDYEVETRLAAQMSSTHNSATVARRTTVAAGYLEVVATSMIEQRQRETGFDRGLLLAGRTLL